MGTLFTTVYDRFLGKITDDMYMEFTPEDTLRDLENLLLEAIPYFEFPRLNLFDYILDNENKTLESKSAFKADLTSEEINILAVLMKMGWLQRQIASIELIRMKYSGPDFRMTSQANHLAKLILLLNETKKESQHAQRLYKRRRFKPDGSYASNWSILRQNSALNNE